jgi:uncharacterized protein YbaR (Trm112 family)
LSLDDVWRELEAETPGPTQMVVRRLDGEFPCPVHAGIEWPGHHRTISLELGTGALPPKLTLPTARGFGARIQPITAGPRGAVRFVIRLQERQFSDVFSAFAQDLLVHVATSRSEAESAITVLSRLARWQRFFDDASESLSPESQRGLFGELLAMRDFFVPWVGVSAAVGAWEGPLGSHQDFQFGGVAVEVKTTATKQHQHLMISSERQLDATGLSRLYLAHFSLDAREGGEGTSLPALVRHLRVQLASDALAQQRFEEVLLAAGYLDIHAARYESLLYATRAHYFYEIRDHFPRILERELRSGVGAVKYTIAVAACVPFAVAEIDVCMGIREQPDG